MGCIESTENIPVPWVLSSLSRHEWLEWKECFRNYRLHKYIPQYQGNRKFFKYTGFLGEEISKRLYFTDSKDETNIEVLLFKFDVFFLFGEMKRQDKEDLDGYVLFLKNAAEKYGSNDKIENIVKEKILQDFKVQNIFRKLQKIDFASRISNYENLSLQELIFLWNECDNLWDEQTNNCPNCNRKHATGTCNAIGNRCYKCGNFNHFAVCCSSVATKRKVMNCYHCGSSHEQNKCPAFAKECSKCKRMNHFSWMCFREIIQSCIYCGKSHVNDRQHCLANNNYCTNCKRRGHFTSNCLHMRNRRFRR